MRPLCIPERRDEEDDPRFTYFMTHLHNTSLSDIVLCSGVKGAIWKLLPGLVLWVFWDAVSVRDESLPRKEIFTRNILLILPKRL